MYPKYPKVGAVQIHDRFWTPYLQNVRRVMLPYGFEKLEDSGYLRNFVSVATQNGNAHEGPPFSDGLFLESLRGACDFLAAEPDAELEKYVDGVIEVISAAAEAEGGFLCTCTTQKFPDNRWGDNGGDIIHQHDLYNHGTLVEAAISHYKATGKTTLLETAVRAANLICNTIGRAPKKNIVPGHSLPEEAFVKLYRLFKEDESLKGFVELHEVDCAAYLEIAEFWYDARGDHRGRFLAKDFSPEYSQDHLTFSKQTEAVGHSVRAMLCYLGAAVVAQEKNRTDFIPVLDRLWENVVNKKLHISGGIGARHDIEGFDVDYHLPNKAYLETCAAIGLAFWNTEMNILHTDAKYFDCFERSLYNNILSAVGADFKHFFYQNPLESDGALRRWDWHGCPCCPPMLLKIFSALNSFIYAYDEECLCVNLYIDSSYENERFSVAQNNGEFSVCSKGETYRVKLRIPEYAENFRVLIAGSPVAYTVENGYAVLEAVWDEENPITVRFDTPVRRIYANPKVEENCGKIAIMRGPFVYCAEGVDNGGDVDVELAEKPDFSQQDDVILALRADGGTGRLIPYYRWCNRGETQEDAKMAVWLKQKDMRSASLLADEIKGKLYGVY